MANEAAGKKSTRLIDLSAEEAKSAFLTSESYFDFDLPPYFRFGPMLSAIEAKLNGKPIKGLWKDDPCELEGINHLILHNKDGQLAWRPQELINPVIYVSLVNTITEPVAWQLIQDRFLTFSSDTRIVCVSHPLRSETDASDKATQIESWWVEVELRSLEYSLEYRHVLQTDVTDCYGSMYTHSIAWALHTKQHAQSKNCKNDASLTGNRVDRLLRSSRRGQTNGIPQGSNLTNFIAEMVLGYADTLLSAAINDAGIKGFKILRYRDDYRIFAKERDDCERIVKLLVNVLRDFGLKLNPSKTSISDDVVSSSVKPDKLAWYTEKHSAADLVQHLLIIHQFSMRYPNSGSVAKAFQRFYRRIEKIEVFKQDVRPLISVATDVAVRNPRVFSTYAAILSKLLPHLEEVSANEMLAPSVREVVACSGSESVS
jgi:RNA-directed DNA polymerase